MNPSDPIYQEATTDDETEVEAQKPKKLTFGVVLGRILLVLLVTVLLLALSLVSVLFCVFRGPSPSARDLLVHSCKESSALKFVPDLFLSSEQVNSIMNATTAAITVNTSDTTVTISDSTSSLSVGQPDAWGLVDDDGDGIILEAVKGSSYSGYMMVVLDPSRVIVGCAADNFGGASYTVEEYVQNFGAVAGINGGGFEDENGMGNGSQPDSLVVFNGTLMNGYAGTKNAFTGIDKDYILHVDLQNADEIQAAGIQWGCGYGPILIQNGEVVVGDSASSGLNPRTAIGQRSDGAILMLVIDGRHVVSLGATYLDEAEIMLRYGAVNASNMDGGSSSMMYYNNEYVNNKAAVIGVRPIPSCWLVLPEGVTYGE